MASTTEEGIKVEEGMDALQDGIDMIIDIMKGIERYNSEELEYIYTIAYNVDEFCIYPKDYQRVYERYKNVLEDYISFKVIPCLMKKELVEENLLQEVVKRWDNHKFMTNWMSIFFNHLDLYYVGPRNLPTLQEVSYSIFSKLILGMDIITVLRSVTDKQRKQVVRIDPVLNYSIRSMFKEILSEGF